MKALRIPVAVATLLVPAAWGQMPLASQRALVNQYCAGCHNEKVKSGGFSWTKIDLAKPGEQVEQLEKVIRKMRAGMMPPSGLPRPDVATTNGFVAAVESGVDQAAVAHLNPGRPPLHRLNRTEYANSIRELL